MKLFFVTLILVFLAGFLMQAPFERLKNKAFLVAGIQSAEEQKKMEETLEEKRRAIFNAIALEAEAVIVREYPGGAVLFEKNADEARPLASLAKLMTAFIAADITQRNTSPFSYVVPITERAVLQEGDSRLLIGEDFLLPDLSDIMLLDSSNDAAYALALFAGMKLFDAPIGEEFAIRAFVSLMNTKKEVLGLPSLYFWNPTGLDREEEFAPGAVGSARDVVELFDALMRAYPAVIEKTNRPAVSIPSSVTTHTFTNTNILATPLPGLVASKTGFTDLAGGNLAVVIDIAPGRSVMIVVLGSTSDGRFEDALELYNALIEYYKE
ncbi:MAG: D-alanyl-D-alanine carboxypeptidase [Candidatus Niyogibacteria bacterium]|nr:D-alanyl-D-alanine carboxypeptidase [Candidatus Niyogibacteria bacterium]